jgi:hypothetical protein
MKHWFEFQEKFHKSKISESKATNDKDYKNFVLFNIPNEIIKPILDIALILLEKGKLDEKIIFGAKKYAEFIKVCYKNHIEIDEKKLQEWLDDPVFDNLMKVAGKELVLDIENKKFRKKIIQCVSKYFQIDWNKADVTLYVQMPGQMFPLHYDGFKSNLFTGVHDKEYKVKRWLIMLEDQKPGQSFQMGDRFMYWKQGDVIAWKNVELPHGSGNFGYWPRFTLRITGEIVN